MNHLAIIQAELSANPMDQTRVSDGNLSEIFPAIRSIDHLQVLVEGSSLDVVQDIERLLNTFTKSELALITSSLLMDNFQLHSDLSDMRYQQEQAEILERKALSSHTNDNQN